MSASVLVCSAVHGLFSILLPMLCTWFMGPLVVLFIPGIPLAQHPYAAVATIEGILINQHLGECRVFHIWEPTRHDYCCRVSIRSFQK